MKKKTTHYLSYLLATLSMIFAIFLDQYTKLLAVENLKNQAPIDIIENVFQLHYLENRGAAFGILQNQKIFFVIIGIIILIVALFFYLKMPHERHFIPLRICLLLIASGAIGNMIDRIRLNYVIDFFYFELIDFPLFNVADIYVTLSAGLLIVLILFYYKEDDLEMLFKLFSRKKNKEQES